MRGSGALASDPILCMAGRVEGLTPLTNTSRIVCFWARPRSTANAFGMKSLLCRTVSAPCLTASKNAPSFPTCVSVEK